MEKTDQENELQRLMQLGLRLDPSAQELATALKTSRPVIKLWADGRATPHPIGQESAIRCAKEYFEERKKEFRKRISDRLAQDPEYGRRFAEEFEVMPDQARRYAEGLAIPMPNLLVKILRTLREQDTPPSAA